MLSMSFMRLDLKVLRKLAKVIFLIPEFKELKIKANG